METTGFAFSFAGTIPEAYERYLGPVVFEPLARGNAARVPVEAGIRVLETACGTGRVTRCLIERLPADGRLVATDLSPAMIAIASAGISDSRIEWRAVDATETPFEAAAFDAVVCQFGVMFFPDKPKGYREARRLLRSGGVFLFSTWAPHADNPWAEAIRATLADLFPNDGEPLFEKPFAFNNEARFRADLREAGFASVNTEWAEIPLDAESAEAFARGFITGTPLVDGIRERGADPQAVQDLLTARYRRELGDAPMRSKMRALVVTASVG
jgi:ubiquinone/menaquinone biosynthesis C-methylase UbiE